jgi:pre-rRNA-processing protein TSR1
LIYDRHKRLTNLQERAAEDLEFPDEVDTPVDQEARVRFQKYKGLKSVKNTKWDPYENLPPEYAKLFEFQNIAHSRKLAIAQAQECGLKLAGKYAKFCIKGLTPTILAGHPNEIPIVNSSSNSIDRFKLDAPRD